MLRGVRSKDTDLLKDRTHKEEEDKAVRSIKLGAAASVPSWFPRRGDGAEAK